MKTFAKTSNHFYTVFVSSIIFLMAISIIVCTAVRAADQQPLSDEAQLTIMVEQQKILAEQNAKLKDIYEYNQLRMQVILTKVQALKADILKKRRAAEKAQQEEEKKAAEAKKESLKKKTKAAVQNEKDVKPVVGDTEPTVKKGGLPIGASESAAGRPLQGGPTP